MIHEQSGPDSELGDEIGSISAFGFGYQSACAAILALQLLEIDSPYDVIYCEHHDDILMKKHDETYACVQVKTRGQHRERLHTSDEDVQKSIRNFVRLDKKYPNTFDEFIIMANCGFWDEGTSHDSLPHVIREIQGGRISRKPRTGALKDLIEFTQSEANSTRHVLDILGKTKTKKMPEKEFVERYIAWEISDRFDAGTRGIDSLGRAARLLIAEIDRRNRLHSDAFPTIFKLLLENRESLAAQQLIEQKKITKTDIEAIVGAALGPSTVLRPREPFDPQNLPRGLRITELKLAFGGLSVETIEHMMDCQNAALEFFISWSNRDPNIAQELENDIFMRVRTHCVDAENATSTGIHPYGTEMYRVLVGALQSRSIIDGVEPRKEYELLLGVVGLLTEECKVWWSNRFDVEGAMQ